VYCANEYNNNIRCNGVATLVPIRYIYYPFVLSKFSSSSGGALLSRRLPKYLDRDNVHIDTTTRFPEVLSTVWWSVTQNPQCWKPVCRRRDCRWTIAGSRPWRWSTLSVWTRRRCAQKLPQWPNVNSVRPRNRCRSRWPNSESCSKVS